MNYIKPIVLKDEGTQTQKHDVIGTADTISVTYIDLTKLISKDPNNTLKIGSDGKLWVRGKCAPPLLRPVADVN